MKAVKLRGRRYEKIKSFLNEFNGTYCECFSHYEKMWHGSIEEGDKIIFFASQYNFFGFIKNQILISFYKGGVFIHSEFGTIDGMIRKYSNNFKEGF